MLIRFDAPLKKSSGKEVHVQNPCPLKGPIPTERRQI